MTKLFKPLAPTAIAISAALVGFAIAPMAYAQMQGNFAEADANHDGRVTFQEFQAYATQRLTTADGMMAQRFRQMSSAQQASRLKQRFYQSDSNHKGFLTPQDWSGR